MKSFSDIKEYLSTAKKNIVDSAQSAWSSDVVQSVVEGVMAPIYSYTSVCEMMNQPEELKKAKNTVIEGAKSVWDSSVAQSVAEGVMAPVYSYTSIYKMMSESKDLKDAIKSARDLNIIYALESMTCFFIYEIVLGKLNEMANDSGSSVIKGGVTSFDYLALAAINTFLTLELIRNIIRNLLIRNTMVSSAAEVMKKSDDFKPAENKVESASAFVSNLLLTLVSYQVTLNTQLMGLYSMGWKTRSLVFLIESVNAGWSFVSYKLNAADVSNEDRLKKLKEASLYIISNGAGFVAASHLGYALINALPNAMLARMGFATMAFNYYTYYAIFNLLFDVYALAAISREKPYPGENQIAIDYWAKLKPYLDTPIMRSFLKSFLQEFSSLDDFLTSKEVSKWASVREGDIRGLLNYVKDGLKDFDSIQHSRTANFAKWLNKLVPGLLPNEVEKILKTKNKTIKNIIIEVEQMLDRALLADAKYSAGYILKQVEPPSEDLQRINLQSRVVVLPPVEIEQSVYDTNGVPKIIPMKLSPRDNEPATVRIIPAIPLEFILQQQMSSSAARLLEAKSSGAKPLETKSLEARLLEAKSSEAKPLETKSLEARLLEAKSLEVKPLEVKLSEAKQEQIKQEEKKVEEIKPAEKKQEKLNQPKDIPMKLQESIVNENYFGNERPVQISERKERSPQVKVNPISENGMFRTVPPPPLPPPPNDAQLFKSKNMATMTASIIANTRR